MIRSRAQLDCLELALLNLFDAFEEAKGKFKDTIPGTEIMNIQVSDNEYRVRFEYMDQAADVKTITLIRPR